MLTASRSLQEVSYWGDSQKLSRFLTVREEVGIKTYEILQNEHEHVQVNSKLGINSS